MFKPVTFCFDTDQYFTVYLGKIEIIFI